MSHTIELKDCSVVVVANDFNISIMNNIWLYKNKIFSESELKNSINLPIHVEVRTDDFIMSIMPNKLQFSVKPSFRNARKVITSKIGKLVKLLPHTPYTAIGLNFIYHITPKNNDMFSLSKSLFFNQSTKLFEGLTDDNVRFGGYFSQDLLGTRFRLDAKPIKISTDGSDVEKFQFSYNFNVNLNSEDAVKRIFELFDKWDDAKSHTEKLTNRINKD